MRNQKKLKYRGSPSEHLSPIVFAGYEIKSLKHGNTGHVLFSFPSKLHNWEPCWTMDLQTAKTGVIKYHQHVAKENPSSSETTVESTVQNQQEKSETFSPS